MQRLKCVLTWQIEIDDILYRLVSLPDLGLVVYYALDLEFLVLDLAQYQHELVHLMTVAYK